MPLSGRSVAEFEKFAAMVNKTKREVTLVSVDKDLIKMIEKESGKEIATTIVNPDKASRESAIHDLIKELVAKYTAKLEGKDDQIKQLPEAVDKVVKDTLRSLILEENKRPDGRGLEDIRPLEAVAGLLPKVHGSGLFTRGQTQVMTIVTLGLPNEAQSIDGLEDDADKRYMHFYNFPLIAWERPGRCEVPDAEKSDTAP